MNFSQFCDLSWLNYTAAAATELFSTWKVGMVEGALNMLFRIGMIFGDHKHRAKNAGGKNCVPV